MVQGQRKGVQVRNLTWTPFASPKPLLKQLTFTVEPGERVLLIGPSGSGKSTLLRAIAGVLQETESGDLLGEIEADSAGLLLQDPNDSLASDTIYREVAFGLENAGVGQPEMRTRVSAAVNSVALNKPLGHASKDLSGGEMQRMAFAGVLAMNPELLLLDEPTSMLDPDSADSVRSAVSIDLEREGSTLIVVEHRFEAWLPIVNRILVLNGDGELVFDGEPNAIIQNHADSLESLGLWLPGLSAPKPKKIELGEPASGQLKILTGASGAGKTTELKRRLNTDSLAKIIPTEIGYVPQQAELTIIGNTVFETASMTAKLVAKQLGLSEVNAIEHTRKLLESLNLSHLENANPYEISGGEQRRLAVATALAHGPTALYLDEPTVGQDRESWAAILGVILSARDSGVQVTVATHDADLIRFADEITVIKPSSSISVKDDVPQVSGLAIFLAPIMLLIGSMGVTSVSRGLMTLAVLFASAAILGTRGFRIARPKVLIPALLGVASIGFSNWYLSEGANPITGLVAAMRVATFVFPGVLLATQLRPIPLGDQLGQSLRLPARPVVAAVAAMQRIESLLGLWSELRFIHSIRGLSIGNTPWMRVSEFSRMVFALLIQAIRGAAVMAVAMNSRGFSAGRRGSKRTWAEPPKRGRLDWLVLGLSAIAAAAPFLIR